MASILSGQTAFATSPAEMAVVATRTVLVVSSQFQHLAVAVKLEICRS